MACYSRRKPLKEKAAAEECQGKRGEEILACDKARSRRGGLPTPYALALGKRSLAICNDLRRVQDIDFLADPTKGEVRIGATEPIVTAIISRVIDRMSRKHPEMVPRIDYKVADYASAAPPMILTLFKSITCPALTHADIGSSLVPAVFAETYVG